MSTTTLGFIIISHIAASSMSHVGMMLPVSATGITGRVPSFTVTRTSRTYAGLFSA